MTAGSRAGARFTVVARGHAGGGLAGAPRRRARGCITVVARRWAGARFISSIGRRTAVGCAGAAGDRTGCCFAGVLIVFTARSKKRS